MVTIDPTPEYMAQLLSMVHSPSDLKSKGFVQKALTQVELLKKARCKKCNKRPRKSKPWKPKLKKKSENEVQTGSKEDEVGDDINQAYQAPPPTGKLSRPIKIQGNCFNCNGVGHRAADCPQKEDTLSSVKQEAPKPPCQWHPGARRGTIFLCCHAHVSTPGCRTASTHTLPTTPTPALTTRFQVHPTPPAAATTNKALAVAIDCETGTALDGEPELIRVTVLDYFTGAALLDSLVWPDVAMEHYNTRWSGVTHSQMRAAKREATCLFGVDAARREVWRYVGVDTVVVGHDVKNDLGALRWTHGVVVDSMLVEAAARKASKRMSTATKSKKQEDGDGDPSGDKPKTPGLSLKDVSKLRLARDIQKRTHDSFEDALASRDIVHHHAMASQD